MNDKTRAAMQQALEVLKEIHPGNMTLMAEEAWNKATTAIREALAQQKLSDSIRPEGKSITKVLPPEPTPLQAARTEIASLKQRLFEMQNAAIDMDKQQFLTQEDIALRWGISGATLERDRSLKQGVRYLKIGGLIRYRLQDVLDYENNCTIETAARKQE